MRASMHMNLGAERPVGFHVLARSEFFLEFLAGDLTVPKDLCKKTTADRLSTVNWDVGDVTSYVS